MKFIIGMEVDMQEIILDTLCNHLYKFVTLFNYEASHLKQVEV